MIDMNGWHADDKLPNGKPVYELKKAVTESGWLRFEGERSCTQDAGGRNTDAGDMLETASTVPGAGARHQR
jgi:hypothetical protein